MRHLLLVISTLLLIVSCGGRKTVGNRAVTSRPFPDAVPPGVMDNPEDRAEYMARHWWDGLTDPSSTYICDSAHVSGVKKEDVEQKFANWLQILGMTDISFARECVSIMYDRSVACEGRDTSSNQFETLTFLVEKYLYDANSPMRNEDLYGVYAEKLSVSDFVSEEKRSVYAYDARKCALNKIGTTAADFRFSDRKGRVRSLYDIKSDYTLLFFSNPGCKACMDIINSLNGREKVSEMITSGKLSVLNIYIDEDLEEWRSYMSVYPENWYNGFDPDFILRDGDTYNIRAIPSLYLLDGAKTVLMKDAVTENLLAVLEAI